MRAETVVYIIGGARGIAVSLVGRVPAVEENIPLAFNEGRVGLVELTHGVNDTQ